MKLQTRYGNGGVLQSTAPAEVIKKAMKSGRYLTLGEGSADACPSWASVCEKTIIPRQEQRPPRARFLRTCRPMRCSRAHVQQDQRLCAKGMRERLAANSRYGVPRISYKRRLRRGFFAVAKTRFHHAVTKSAMLVGDGR
jgi:hypothetical protein